MSREMPVTQSFAAGELPARRRAGDVLNDRYHLVREVGHGAMGVVWQAMDVKLEREVAIKMVPEESLFPDARERLLREARAAAGLNHPHIVAVHDVGEDRGVPFFVMELVAGTSLGDRRPSELPEVVAIAAQICSALEHAHAHGLVHRDLKPDNVLLAAEHDTTVVKLADLGLAVPARGSRLTQAGTVVGTVAYMAPEQALGDAIDGRADLYSLGVVLYELTTGRLPFTGDRPLTVISQHVNAPVVPPRTYRPDLPPALEAVILRLMRKQPSQRFATATETGLALRACLAVPGADAAAGDAPGVQLLDALARGRLVGRATELGEARTIWSRAREGKGHGLLVSGEPGAGKTRLCREVMIQAAFEGAVVMSGACYEYEAATPYLPFAEAFRKLVREHRDAARLRAALGDGAPLLARLAPEIEARLGPFPERAELPPHEARLLFLDAVAQAFRGLAAGKALLFYVDDLQWADGSSLWLFGHLLRNLREERVLLLASYREAELDRSHPLSKALVEWNRERLTTRVVLRRFGPEGTREQLAALLGEKVTTEFAQAVHRETEGNPFFVEEVLKALIEDGAVRRDEGGWQRCAVNDLRIPQSVKAAIGNRLDRVDAACNEALRTAAVLGKTFDFDELAAATQEASDEGLLDALDLAVNAQLLVAGRDGAYAFTHDKIREVLYEELNPIRRRRLHLRAAEGLERRRGRRAVPVETLAHHFIEAGEHERGLSYAKEAGAEAERLLAYDEAIAAYARAEQCAEALGRTGERAELQEAMGKVAVISGRQIPAIGHFERALAIVKEPSTRARLQMHVALSLVTLGDPRGLHCLEEAFAILDPERQPVELAYAKAIEARFHHLQSRHRRAVDLLLEAVRLATPADPGVRIEGLRATTLTQAFAYLAGAHQHLGLFAESDRWARRAIELGEAHGIPHAVALGFEFLGENTISTGSWRDGIENAMKEREIATRIHSRERRAWTYLVTSICGWLLGEHAKADAEAVEGIALADAIGERRVASLLAGGRAPIVADLGRLDEALALGLEAVERADGLALDYMRTDARQRLAMVHRRRGEHEAACLRCEEVLRINGDGEPVVTRLWIGPVHVESLRALGRHEEAARRLAAWAAIVRSCQAPYFERELARLS